MSLSSDNFTALIYLRDQARKWKNIAFLAFAILVLLSSKFFLSQTEEKINTQVSGGKDYIANIAIEGTILDDDYRTKVLKKVSEQENIKAAIININSPGGGMVGSEILYENLLEISKNKPIVVTMGSLAASGGYMVAIASDYIIARNGTLTGSIGIIMQSTEVTKLADKIGVKFLTYKSSKLKGAPSPFEKTNPQVDKVINASIKDSYKFFTDLVLDRRSGKLNEKEIKNVIDGRVFTGRQALENGLIDEIGGKNEAIKYLKEAHNIDVDNLEVRDISVKKSEGKFIEKLFGNYPVSEVFNWKLKNQGLMSIMDL